MLKHLVIASGRLPAAEIAALAVEFPTVEIHGGAPVEVRAPVVDAAAWEDPSSDLGPLDGEVAAAAAKGQTLRVNLDGMQGVEIPGLDAGVITPGVADAPGLPWDETEWEDWSALERVVG